MNISNLFAFPPRWYRKLCQSHERSYSSFRERAKFSLTHHQIKSKAMRTENKSLILPGTIIWLSKCPEHWRALMLQSHPAQHPSLLQCSTIVFAGERDQQSPEKWEQDPPSQQQVLSRFILPKAERCRFDHSTYCIAPTSLKVQKQSVERCESIIALHDPSPTSSLPTPHHPHKQTACLPPFPSKALSLSRLTFALLTLSW